MTGGPVNHDALALFRAERLWGHVKQTAQWMSEAAEVRAASEAEPALPRDQEASTFTNRMLDAECRGIARWDERERDWYLITAAPTSRRPSSQCHGGR